MYNRVILIGRLTRDPEIRTTPNGISVALFSLAVNRNYVSQSGVKEVDFFNCVCYRKLADIIGMYVKKGLLVNVEGKIQNRSYTAQDGTKRYITEIICDSVVFLESARSQSEVPRYQETPTFTRNEPQFVDNNQDSAKDDEFFADNPDIDISEDDLPF